MKAKFKNFFLKIKDWFIRHKPSKRRLIQVYAALLYNANIKGFITGNIYTGKTKYACVPGLNCYSCPGAVGACPLGSLQNALTDAGNTAPYYIIGIIALFGLILGRTICGFLCPVGLAQELLYKIKTPKIKKNCITHVLSFFKYVVLVVLVIILTIVISSVTGSATPAFCKYICPAGTFGGGVGLLAHPENASFFDMLSGLFTWKFALLVLIIVLSIFCFRFFCRFLCPLGAIYGFFNKFALLGVKIDKSKCTDCGLCVNHCKMDIKHVGDHECVECGECISVCPTQAISWKGSKIFLHSNAVKEEETTQPELTSLLESGTTLKDDAGKEVANDGQD
ncbi:MAG: 4Fe-4S binding protein [Clostridia bacterium]|nr:4Fe-4S binding protein [Clostridia bacterium]